MEQRDLIAAIATGAGTGAVGMVRLSGPGMPALFRPLLGRESLQPRLATLCRFLGPAGELLDQGLALYFPAPGSYTGQDVLELQGHGGRAVLESVLARCLELGARPAQPGEFTYRAYVNGRMDLAQAEAVADLIEAKTAAAARSAVRALSGEFSRQVEAIAAELLRLRVLVEAGLDFPEEDVDLMSSRQVQEALRGIVSSLEALNLAARRGQLLRGARVVLAGPPNVGKSSLLNRLAGDEVAIVTPSPGTTRDIVRATIELQGIPVELLDTAGLRQSDDPVERIGIQRTHASVAQAHLVLAVEDCTSRGAGLDLRSMENVPHLKVLNKADLLEAVADAVPREGIRVSAKTGEGIDALRRAISRALGLDHLEEGSYLARERHIRQIVRARQCMEAAGLAADPVLLAEELRLAHAALGEITGQASPDDLLGQIFSKFCIGK